MVKFLFCPNCAAMDIQKTPQGIDCCARCHFRGTAIEGSMDKLNEYRQKLKKNHNNKAPSMPESISKNPLIGSTRIKQNRAEPEGEASKKPNKKKGQSLQKLADL